MKHARVIRHVAFEVMGNIAARRSAQRAGSVRTRLFADAPAAC
jgi:hypothetical protein